MSHTPNVIDRPVYTLGQIGDFFGGKSPRWVYNLVHTHGLKVTRVAGCKVVLADDLAAFIEAAKAADTVAA